ncbi:MAG: ABC transporter substrate-binding protein [Stellaceae bacterium]
MRNLTRRTILAAAPAALAVTALRALTSTACAETSALLTAARKEGQVTWYVSQLDDVTAHLGAKAFMKRYPGVTVNTIRMTTQVAYQRVLQEIAHNVVECDVFSTADVGQYVRLEKAGRLAKYTPPNSAKLSRQFQNFDPNGYYYPTTSGLVLIAYNNKKVSESDAPKNWDDIIEPKWTNKLTVGSPLFGAYAGNWAILMNKLYGWKYFTQLKKINPLITRSIIDTVSFLNSGERWVSVSPSPTVLESISRGNPIKIVYPKEGTVLMIVPSSVLAKAPHPNAGRLFLNFLMSVDYQSLLQKRWYEPVRSEVPPLPGVKPLAEIKTVHLSRQTVNLGIPEIIKKWRDLFGI